MKKILFIISMLITLSIINTSCVNQSESSETTVKKSQNVFFEVFYKTYCIQINVVTNEDPKTAQSHMWSILSSEGVLYNIFNNYDEYEITKVLTHHIENEFIKENLNMKIIYLKVFPI